MSTPELRPMGIGDILDATFRLYRQRFVTFLLIALVVYVPFAIIATGWQLFLSSRQSVASGFSDESGESPDTRIGDGVPSPQFRPEPFDPSTTLLGLIPTAIFGLFFAPLCSAALVHNISAGYLGEELAAIRSYGRAGPRLLPLIGATMLWGLIIYFPLVLMVPIGIAAGHGAALLVFALWGIWGLVFALWFLVYVPVVVLEKANGSRALGRSRELMRGNVWKGFLLMLLVVILCFIINWVILYLVGLVPWPHSAIPTFLDLLLPVLVLPISTAPLILLYYDLRIRKEAFDLQRLSEALVQPAAT